MICCTVIDLMSIVRDPSLGVVGRGRGGAVRKTVKERVKVPD
jgi:hypothetical protein